MDRATQNPTRADAPPDVVERNARHRAKLETLLDLPAGAMTAFEAHFVDVTDEWRSLYTDAQRQRIDRIYANRVTDGRRPAGAGDHGAARTTWEPKRVAQRRLGTPSRGWPCKP